MRISDSQYGALCTLRDHGPQKVLEVLGPPKMDGSRKAKIEGSFVTAQTLNRLEQLGAISVQRGVPYRLKNAVGKPGLKRCELRITITDKGRAALSEAEGR